MSLLLKRVIVRANGKPRTLFLIEEVRKGDVYIKLKSERKSGFRQMLFQSYRSGIQYTHLLKASSITC
jgi:hypothetical protein